MAKIGAICVSHFQGTATETVKARLCKYEAGRGKCTIRREFAQTRDNFFIKSDERKERNIYSATGRLDCEKYVQLLRRNDRDRFPKIPDRQYPTECRACTHKQNLDLSKLEHVPI